MRARRLLFAILVILAVPLAASYASTVETEHAAAHRPVHVVTSIPPLAMVVSQIGGTHVRVQSILQAGSDPHTFEPRPSDAIAVSEADIVVAMGSSIDDWLGDAITPSPGAILVQLDRESAPAGGHGDDEHDGGHDPHVWLDPLWVRDHAIGEITRALMQADPDAGPQYNVAARTMTEQLTDLDTDIDRMLAAADTRTFLAWHPAWSHFAARFHLHALGAVGETEGREPSLKAMIATIRAARAAGVHAVLIEPQIDRRQPSVLADELGVPLVPVDSLGDLASLDRSTYSALIQFNARAFRRALAVESPRPSPDASGVNAAPASPVAR